MHAACSKQRGESAYWEEKNVSPSWFAIFKKAWLDIANFTHREN